MSGILGHSVGHMLSYCPSEVYYTLKVFMEPGKQLILVFTYVSHSTT